MRRGQRLVEFSEEGAEDTGHWGLGAACAQEPRSPGGRALERIRMRLV